MVMTTESDWKVMSASTIKGDGVVNGKDEKLGTIEEVMIDVENGRIAYAVLSFGGFLGMGDKLFAIPWNAFRIDSQEKRFILDVPKEKLEKAPGFDQDHWPDMADRAWSTGINTYYGAKPHNGDTNKPTGFRNT